MSASSILPGRRDLIAALVECHATLTVLGSALDAPGWQRLRLLQRAHALEPIVCRHWPQTYDRRQPPRHNSDHWLAAEGDKVWLQAATQAGWREPPGMVLANA
jgi:hypothetical protein